MACEFDLFYSSEKQVKLAHAPRGAWSEFYVLLASEFYLFSLDRD